MYLCSANNKYVQIMEAKKVTYEEALARFKHSLEVKHEWERKVVERWKRIASQKQAKDADVMSMAELEDIVRQGEKDIAEGNFQPIAIDDLWK